ncbi:hypothetical protein ACWGF2_19885 [Streptomyces sp. NPDC054919]
MTFLPTIDTKLNIWTLAAVLTALYTLFGLGRGWWQTSLGKRRRLIRAYRRMAPYVRHDYVKDLFGEPAWEHTRRSRSTAPTRKTKPSFTTSNSPCGHGRLAHSATWSPGATTTTKY